MALAVMAMFVVLPIGAVRADFPIGRFNDHQNHILYSECPDLSYHQWAASAPSAIGDNRIFSIQIAASPVCTPQRRASNYALGGLYSFNQESGVAATGAIVWSGSNSVGAFNFPLADRNFASSGSYFTFSFVDSDNGPHTLYIDCYGSSVAKGSRAALAIPTGHNTAYVLTARFAPAAQSDFTLPAPGASAPVDWTDVRECRLNWGPKTDFDFTLDAIDVFCDATVPGPITFTATPNPLPVGQTQTNLCWNVAGTVTSVSIDQGIGTVGASGCLMVTPPSFPITYTLTAKNDCKEASAQVIVYKGQITKVPSLTEWGVIVLSLILAISAFVLMRKRNSIG